MVLVEHCANVHFHLERVVGGDKGVHLYKLDCDFMSIGITHKYILSS
jgi:hypothetical protein